MPFTEDLAAFTDPADFGDEGTYTPTGGVAKAVNGIFDAEYEAALDMDGSGPVFECAEADVPNVARGDTLTVRGIGYVVKGVQPDRTGWMRLVLELVDG